MAFSTSGFVRQFENTGKKHMKENTGNPINDLRDKGSSATHCVAFPAEHPDLNQIFANAKII